MQDFTVSQVLYSVHRTNEVSNQRAWYLVDQRKRPTGKTASDNNLWVENFLTDITAPLRMKVLLLITFNN